LLLLSSSVGGGGGILTLSQARRKRGCSYTAQYIRVLRDCAYLMLFRIEIERQNVLAGGWLAGINQSRSFVRFFVVDLKVTDGKRGTTTTDNCSVNDSSSSPSIIYMLHTHREKKSQLNSHRRSAVGCIIHYAPFVTRLKPSRNTS
jgi:hypothetical protein